ncbi:MAG: class I SAM-dependent methyltransferase [Bacteroidota bacterium]
MSEFDVRAQDWDMNPMHTERSMAIANQMMKTLLLSKTMKAMEFGAGTGLLSYFLKDQFAEITLVDSSIEMLKKASVKFEGQSNLHLETVYIDLEKEEYTGGTFDVIYSQMVLHHIKDVSLILKKFHRLLNPGGILAIADLYQEDGSFHDGDLNVHHGFDPEKLVTILRLMDFQVTGATPCFVIKKELASKEIREFPVFLINAVK